MELFLGILAAWGGVMLIWTLIGVVLLPLSRRSDTRVTVVLRSQGDAPRLEQYLKGLIWLRDMGFVWWDVAVLEDDLGSEARARAFDLTASETHCDLISKDELIDWMEL